MDREYPTDRAELEDKEVWPYNDLQSLAADLDYGNPVGEDRADLVDHAVDDLDLPAEATGELNREVDREVDRQVDREIDREGPTIEEESESISRQGTAGERADASLSTDEGGDGEERAPDDPIGDGGTQTADSTDGIDVGHQGKEKLSPAGAPESDGTAVEPPGDLETDDIDRDVLESDAAPATNSDAGDDVEDDDDSEEQGEGGLRERLGIGSSDESPEDVVDEADDPEERERREEMKEKFEQAMGDGADQDDVDDAVQDAQGGAGAATAPTTTPAGGMMMDQEVVGSLIEMPFNFASGATGWDGWELSQRERKANARLFAAMCDEHDVDVSATTMFGLSMASTFGGKAVRYRRQTEDDQEDVVDGAGEPVDDQDGADFGDDVEEVAGRDGRRRRGTTSTENTEQQSESGGEETFGF